ncbi:MULTISPECIES: hypothetical protein [unclassified Pedobacter]|uniref:hypothetical protein n=1 Tax=unclassified Pedobacter TaxID=2628915 RepID=UPI00142248A8|nr:MULTISPECIES: hypothetical protein [unclassified Pedobacter]NII81527.1 rRNA-processing protein FCF1 [Pedobacter sp. SG908]NMN35531.1 rRNA-processing protein FCF1 [Pedobacter sp. SG918]
MKKNKSKSKNHSTSKKLRKELESKLALAFNELVIQYGKAKKTDKVIEKFAKQLTKKVTFATQDNSITPYIKEEETPIIAPKAKTVKPVAAKKAVKKEPVTE